MSGGGSGSQEMAAARDALEQIAQQRFAFLLTEKGWARGPTERSAHTTSFYYKNRPMVAQLGVQALLDIHDGAVEVYLVRLREGKIPKSTVDDPFRQPVALLLRTTLHIKDEQLDRAFELARTKKPWNAQQADELLAIYSSLVARHLDAILQQPLDVIFPPRGLTR